MSAVAEEKNNSELAQEEDRSPAEMARILLEGALLNRLRRGPIGSVLPFTRKDAG